MLKPQDIVLALKLLTFRGAAAQPTYLELAQSLQISPSEAHSAVNRTLAAGLLRRTANLPQAARQIPQPTKTALAEFLIHGLKYVWPASRGPIARGIPTGSSLAPIAEELGIAPPPLPLVWAHPEGTVRGESIVPLVHQVPGVCSRDAALQEWLALIDLVRLKTGREAALAAAAIERRLS